MACRFLEDFGLRSLIAPVTDAKFKSDYWERKPLIIHRGAPDYYADLFTLQDFDEAITRSPGYVKTAEATANKQSKHQGSSTHTLERVLTDMRDGFTLILDAMHLQDPKLGLMCRKLSQEMGYAFQTNLYLTPANGKGFGPHWDNHDVFILQVWGSKQWKVEKERRTLPGKTEVMAAEGREIRGEPFSFNLQQGDMVYIPRGYIHAAECAAEPSLHITLGVHPHTWEDLLTAAIAMAVRKNEKLKLALPIGYLSSASPSLVCEATDALAAMSDRAFLSEVVDQFKDEIVQKLPLDISGQVTSFFSPTPLAIDMTAGPRPGIIFNIHENDDSVRLNFGTRAITFPSFFAPALKFSLTRSSYAISELPGELEDSERLVFIERLLQEGLVVRR